jgi:hypothetical protein
MEMMAELQVAAASLRAGVGWGLDSGVFGARMRRMICEETVVASSEGRKVSRGGASYFARLVAEM